MINKNILTVVGATIAASLCCVTPVLAVLAGSSSLASSFSWLAPYHNYLVVFTIAVLLYAWYDKLKPSKNIACDCPSERFYNGKTFLSLVTVFTVFMLSFPLWGSSIFESAPSSAACATGTCDTNLSKKSDKKLLTLKVATSNSSCDAPIKCTTAVEKPKVQNSINIDSLPVLQYMNSEQSNPTPYNQQSCSGTGYEEVDTLLYYARQVIEEMPPPVLKKMIDNDEDFILLDVREENQRASGEIYVSDSYAFTLGKLAFNVMNTIKDKNSVIVVYSKVGGISVFGAEVLHKLGYKHVYSLKGGLKAWAMAGYPYDTDYGAVVATVEFE